MYCIIDIETTGGDKKTGKITEVAIYRHNGQKVIDEFVTLINPERNIPPNITYLTGITNEMVSSAPKFYEVAKQIIEITSEAVFVAHNVNFDYGFVAKEFKELGYDFSREKICTVRKSRQLIPGMHSYSLGKLCQQLGIQINGRHRAAGDALATVELFERLLRIEPEMQAVTQKASKSMLGLNTNLNPEIVYQLPELTGVYYFRNQADDIIYIGKSKNIKSRVLTHLRLNKSERVSRMQQEIHAVDYELTGSELVSLIRESVEIKKYKPKFNRAQRRSFFPFAIFHRYDLFGYMHFYCDKTNSEQKALTVCASKQEAKSMLFRLCEEFNLCYGLCSVGECGKSCFHHSVEMCAGALLGKEPASSYNLRAEAAMQKLEYESENILIVDDGRHQDEIACLLVQNGVFRGYGYADKSYAQHLSDLTDCIQYIDETRDIKQIVRYFLKKQKVKKVIPLELTS